MTTTTAGGSPPCVVGEPMQNDQKTKKMAERRVMATSSERGEDAPLVVSVPPLRQAAPVQQTEPCSESAKLAIAAQISDFKAKFSRGDGLFSYDGRLQIPSNPQEPGMANTAHDVKNEQTLAITEETSLVDLIKLRDQGVDFRQLAPMFEQGLAGFEAKGHNLYRRTLLGPSDAESDVHYPREDHARRMIILASNNYLGLTNHPEVIEAACSAAHEHGTGAGASPLLVGTYPITRELESNLARFKGTDDACVFATGYQANVGVISSVAGKNDLVVLDRLAHASMVDGAKMSGAQVRIFRHNDAEHLDRVLSRRERGGRALVCVEGIYSMDGDTAPLDEICPIVRKHNAMLLVDEAHSTGVLGPDGRGAVAHFGLHDEVDLIVGTLSKSLGARAVSWPAIRPRSLIFVISRKARMFSTAPSPMVTAAANAALNVLKREPERREQLWSNCRFMHASLNQMGFKINPEPSPIIPVIVGSMTALRHMTLELHHNNICVNSVPFPAVQHGSERLRISLTANHTQAQLVEALEYLRQAGRNAEIL